MGHENVACTHLPLLSVFLKDGKLLNSWATVSFSRRIPLHGVSCIVKYLVNICNLRVIPGEILRRFYKWLYLSWKWYVTSNQRSQTAGDIPHPYMLISIGFSFWTHRLSYKIVERKKCNFCVPYNLSQETFIPLYLSLLWKFESYFEYSISTFLSFCNEILFATSLIKFSSRF